MGCFTGETKCFRMTCNTLKVLLSIVVMERFVNLVKNNLAIKMANNPSFSLRTYAKQLGVSPATLSGVLNGKRRLSADKIGKIGFALGLNPEEIWDFQRESLGTEAVKRKSYFNELSQDIFITVSEWYHLAILEVMKLPDFKPNAKWIAKRLQIKETQAKLAIERLQRVGILKISKAGKWVDNMDGFTTHYQKDKTNDAKKRYQKELLEKSIQSLMHDDYSERDHSSTTMAINIKDIGKAKDMIKHFRKQLSQCLEANKKPNEVYQLQVSFFPITKINKGDKS